MSAPEGYCDNGIHYIGDRDHCAKCAVWQRKQMKKHVFYAAVEAHRLCRVLNESCGD